MKYVARTLIDLFNLILIDIMSELSYDKEIVDSIIDEQHITFDKMDKLLINLPKDVNKIIYSYYSKYCKSCGDCCSLCKFYCMEECLREVSGSDICCNLEHKYLMVNHNIIKNRKIINVEILAIAGSDELIIQA